MINKFIGIGYLTKNPELKNLGDYKKCEFSVAINSSKRRSYFSRRRELEQSCRKLFKLFVKRFVCLYRRKNKNKQMER